MDTSKDINIKISQFEGPLDLLLHLIKINEVDIYDIPISEITNQYVNYLKQMKQFNLEIAGEFIVMASTLIRIKSEWLIPRKEEAETEEEVTVDPRQELSDRLAEYQLYKEISQKLKQRQELRHDYHTRLPADVSEYQHTIPLEQGEIDRNDLVQAFFRVAKRKIIMNPPESTIEQEVETIEDKIINIKLMFEELKTNKIDFAQIIKKPNRAEVVNSLLAVLELMKQQEILVYQDVPFETIEIVLREQVDSK